MLSRVHFIGSTLTRMAVLSLCLLSPLHANAADDAESSATLPLAKVLEMQKLIDDAAEEIDATPPIAATIHRVAVSGRLLEQGVEFNVHYDIDVLAADTWVELPLLTQDAQTHLLALPQVADGAFAVVDGTLRFVTRQRKRYSFDLTVIKEAAVEGLHRSVRLELADASVSVCKVTFDDDLFELQNRRVLAKPDGVQVFPTDGAYVVEWELREAAVVSAALEKPDIASVIPAAYASSVSTLEGMRITRLLYQLRFAGRKPIEFEIPANQTVERAYLNGFAVPVQMEGRQLLIQAAPAQAGDEGATVELVLMAEDGVYHLAGDLALTLPRASWPMNEVYLSLHLPAVFTYQWKGGSLSPVEAGHMPEFTYRVPLPGKKMAFHQYLVTTQTPHVSIAYAVDLEDQYFCAAE